METSDSEYFESADEDFESDYDERKKYHQSEYQNVNDKIIESELCKLKLIKSKDREDDATQKNVFLEVNDDERKESQLEKPLVVNDNKITQEKQSDSNKSKENVTLEVLRNVSNPLKPTFSEGAEIEGFRDSDERVNDNLQWKEPDKETIVSSLVENTDIDQTMSDDNIKTIKINQNSLIEPEKEDNLWDDDEIDWGSEAVKEESRATDGPSPISKNDDSGWDDFDVDWESENQKAIPTEIKNNPTNDSKSLKVENTSKTTSKESQSHPENLWEDDDGWEPLEKPVEEKPKGNEPTWGRWGGWGVTSLLTTATQGVSSLTTHVSQGLSTVLETGIGIPEPEDMARINKLRLEKKNRKELEEEDKELQDISDSSPSSPVGFGLGNLVSGVSQLTKFVETTGTKVITGGLDTLEAIGKKTVEVLQEGDPGLKKKRAFLKLDSGKPNLSQILREAKEQAEQENKDLTQRHIAVKRVKNYEALFDDHQGLVHLEALEMLSKLCSIKLQNLNNSLSGQALKDMQETLNQVKELCELPEDEEDEKVSTEETTQTISNAVKEINIPISYDKVLGVCSETDTWLTNINMNFIDDVELHQQAIDTLAQLTAFAVEQFHKTGELLLVKEHRSTADEADSLVQITVAVKSLILNEAGKFTDKLNSINASDKDKINEHITNIFYEAANSGSYIQDAFHLLVPVLQVGAV